MPTLPPIFTLTLNPGLDRTLTVPVIEENAVLRATHSQLDWGGKGFNVTRALQALGVNSVALGCIGGATGQMLADGLHNLGIATDFITLAGETRTNTVILEEESDRYLKVNEAGPSLDGATVRALRARIQERLVPNSYWALCGSLPPGAAPDLYASLIELVQNGGGRACLDTWGEALRLGCQARPYLIKPNAEEASELTGIQVDSVGSARQAAEQLLAWGAQIVALSMGRGGVLLASQTEVIHARPPEVSVQTVVGVGDALLAGVILALRQEAPLEMVARWGVAAGTASAMKAGVGMGDRSQVESLLDRVEVRVDPAG